MTKEELEKELQWLDEERGKKLIIDVSTLPQNESLEYWLEYLSKEGFTFISTKGKVFITKTPYDYDKEIQKGVGVR